MILQCQSMLNVGLKPDPTHNSGPSSEPAQSQSGIAQTSEFSNPQNIPFHPSRPFFLRLSVVNINQSSIDLLSFFFCSIFLLSTVEVFSLQSFLSFFLSSLPSLNRFDFCITTKNEEMSPAMATVGVGSAAKDVKRESGTARLLGSGMSLCARRGRMNR